jgi:hypothetical protein
MAARPNVRELWLSASVLAITMGMIAWILKPPVAAIWHSREAQRELVAFTSGLELGLSQADVRGRLAAARPKLLTASEVDASLMLVQTPLTFGAGNWVAWLDFSQGRLASVRIRITDGERFKPDGSPSDVGVPPPPRH